MRLLLTNDLPPFTFDDIDGFGDFFACTSVLLDPQDISAGLEAELRKCDSDQYLSLDVQLGGGEAARSGHLLQLIARQ